MPARLSFPVVVVAAVLVALSVPPFGFWPLALAGLGLLAHVWWASPSRRRRASLGFVFAYVHLGITCFWITEFQAVGLVVLLAMMSGFFAAAGALLPMRTALARIAGFTGAVTAAETLRGRIPWGGFPMGGIPMGQADSVLTPVARLGGTVLLTLVTVAVGGVLATAAALASRPDRGEEPTPVDVGHGSNRWRAAVPALGAGLVVVAMVVVGHVLPAGKVVGDITVAAVQGGGERGTRALETPMDEVLLRHLQADAAIPPASVDVVLWPENAINADGPFEGSRQQEAISQEAQRLRTLMLVGVVEDAGPGRFRNAQIAIGPDGRTVGRYDKVHRVPFGEYAPLRSLIAKVADLQLLPSDAIPGKGPGLLRGPDGEPLGVVISYEVFFGDRSRAAIGAGGQVLLVPTNASSYKTAQVPDQEVAAARLRAWETGREVLQVAPTGFSARVDVDGTVTSKTDLGARAVITERLTLRTGTTPYQRWGDAPWLFVTIALLLAPHLDRSVKRR